MSFKKKVITAILNRADIVDIIANFLPLKQRGLKDTGEYIVSCPFHNERTPSFTITRQKQFYHCFGCGAHGNAIAFVSEFKGVTYPEAIIKVAELCNFKLPIGKTTPSKKKISDRRKRIKKNLNNFLKERFELTMPASRKNHLNLRKTCRGKF